MSNPALHRKSRHWLTSILLVAVAFRALIPVGFMPSGERPFTLELCPDWFPAHLFQPTVEHSSHGAHAEHAMAHDAHAAHHAHPESSSHSAEDGSGTDEAPGTGSMRADYCVFAAAVASAGPAPHVTLLPANVGHTSVSETALALPRPLSPEHRIQQPRAPPALS
jgi:hypothetical protein